MKQGILLLAAAMMAFGEEAIRPGASVYVNPMDGFGGHVYMALRVASVPLLVTNQRNLAEYELAGNEEKPAGRKFGFPKAGKGIVVMRLQKVKTGEVLYTTNVRTDKASGGPWHAAKAFALDLEVAVRSGRVAKSTATAGLE